MDLQYKFHDSVGNYSHPESAALRNEIKQLTTEIEEGKNPHEITSRLENVQNHLRKSYDSNSGIMNYEHNNYLHDSYRDMEQTVRKMPHYW